MRITSKSARCYYTLRSFWPSLFVLSRLFLNMVGRRLGSFYRIRRIDLGDESRTRCSFIGLNEFVLSRLFCNTFITYCTDLDLSYWNSAKGFFSIFKITTISLFLPLSFRKFHIPDGKKISLSSQKKKKKKILRRLKENVLSLKRRGDEIGIGSLSRSSNYWRPPFCNCNKSLLQIWRNLSYPRSSLSGRTSCFFIIY